MFDISPSLTGTEKIQHPELMRVLVRSLMSLLFAALEFAMLPGSLVSIASLHTANMNAAALAIASLWVEGEANVTPIRRLGDQVQVSVLALGATAFEALSIAFVLLELAFPLSFGSWAPVVVPFLGCLLKLCGRLRSCQCKWGREVRFLEIWIFRHFDECFAQRWLTPVDQLEGLASQAVFILQHQRPAGLDRNLQTYFTLHNRACVKHLPVSRAEGCGLYII